MKLPQNHNKLTNLDKRKVREAYVIEQHGLCAYCSTSIKKKPKGNRPVNLSLFTDDFIKCKVHLHYDSKTGLTIGALHALCLAELLCYKKA